MAASTESLYTQDSYKFVQFLFHFFSENLDHEPWWNITYGWDKQRSSYAPINNLIVKPWPQTLSPKTQKPKTKGPWADTKIQAVP